MIQTILQILQITLGAAQGVAKGDTAEYEQIAADLLRVAQSALAAHSTITGLPIDQVISQLHELPIPEGDGSFTSGNGTEGGN